MRTDLGPVAIIESGIVAVLPLRLKLVTDPPSRTAEVGAAVHGGELVRVLGRTEVVAEAIHNGVATRIEIIRVEIDAADDGAGPGANLPIIPRVVIPHALDRVHARADRCLVLLRDFPRIPETHLATSIDALLQFRQNARSCTLAVWSRR